MLDVKLSHDDNVVTLHISTAKHLQISAKVLSQFILLTYQLAYLIAADQLAFSKLIGHKTCHIFYKI